MLSSRRALKISVEADMMLSLGEREGLTGVQNGKCVVSGD